MTTRPPNRLSQETSPYLLKHAHNPVDWYSWGRDAHTHARELDRPILLSIGYSACHWCHVMEHESFEDEAVAAVMNAHFVCIKVDREERPDLDRIYQMAHQLLARRAGGWPLTMFLDPRDHTPFFAGTYFPKEARFGLPGFPTLLERVAEYYREHRDALAGQNASVREALLAIQHEGGGQSLPDRQILRKALRALEADFDPVHGGFGDAPKFPHPTTLAWCLGGRLAPLENRRAAEAMALATLQAMARGGIYDHLGGGFFRYSVDARWEIPHFEKMLYDNGPLLALYAEAGARTGDPRLLETAAATGHWLLREMSAPDGGFSATLDADSEGEEGRFYVFERSDLGHALNDGNRLAGPYFGLDGPANFEGRWHLSVPKDIPDIAQGAGVSEAEVRQAVADVAARLRALRDGRPRPGRDDKVLTSWNALAIRGLARAGRLLAEPAFIDAAERAFDFVHTRLWREGRLLASYKDGRATLPAYLDDYAFLVDAGIELLQARWRAGDLEWLVALAETLIDHFEDRANGGFFFTADDHEALLYRTKPGPDEATPSGNAVAALALTRLAHLTGRLDFEEAARRTVEAFATSLTRHPQSLPSLLYAFEETLEPSAITIVRGPADDLAQLKLPARGFFLKIPNGAQGLIGPSAELPVASEVVAYVCEGTRCGAPLMGEALAQFLAQPGHP